MISYTMYFVVITEMFANTLDFNLVFQEKRQTQRY